MLTDVSALLNIPTVTEINELVYATATEFLKTKNEDVILEINYYELRMNGGVASHSTNTMYCCRTQH